MPFYDDFDMKKSAEDYAQRVKMLDKFKQEDLAKVVHQTEVLLPYSERLAALPERNEEEEKLLTDLLTTLKKTHKATLAVRMVLEERLLIKSLVYYDHIKKLATEGNAEAQKIFEDLKGLADEEPSLN